MLIVYKYLFGELSITHILSQDEAAVNVRQP